VSVKATILPTVGGFVSKRYSILDRRFSFQGFSGMKLENHPDLEGMFIVTSYYVFEP